MAQTADEVILDCDSYISAVILAVWDNVEGTRKLRTWRSSHPANKHNYTVPKESLDFVSNHSLVAEASRALVDLESMFYCLSNKNIIAIAFLFSVPSSHNNYPDLFSLSIVLPLSELTEWLSRHTLLVNKMKAILKFNLIPNLTRLAKQPKYKTTISFLDPVIKNFIIQEDVVDVPELSLMQKLQFLLHKPKDFIGFVKLATGIRYSSVPDPDLFTVNETYLGSKLNNKSYGMIHFLERVITAFLYQSGYAIVIGRKLEKIQKMIRTLSCFMSTNERRLSLMITPDQDLTTLGYQAGLYVQGFLYEEEQGNYLPTNLVELTSEAYRPIIIDVTRLEVREIVNPVVTPLQQSLAVSLGLLKRAEMDQVDLTCKRKCLPIMLESAPLIHYLLSMVSSLSHHNCTREHYISHYMTVLHNKACTLSQYVNDTWTPSIGRIDLVQLMEDLYINNGSDLRLLLGLAGKDDPSIISKVLPIDYSIPVVEYLSALQCS